MRRCLRWIALLSCLLLLPQAAWSQPLVAVAPSCVVQPQACGDGHAATLSPAACCLLPLAVFPPGLPLSPDSLAPVWHAHVEAACLTVIRAPPQRPPQPL